MVGNKINDEIEEAMMVFQTHDKVGNKQTAYITIEKRSLSSRTESFSPYRTDLEGLEIFRKPKSSV